MPEAVHSSPTRLRMAPMGWHAPPLTSSTKTAIMDSFSHYENFSYDEKKGGFLVEVPVPPGRGKVSRATPAVLKDHVEVNIKLTRGGKLATNQAKPPLEECYSWWLGQLLHYGLPLVLSTDEAKQAVKSKMLAGDLNVPAHLRKMEQRMRTAIRRREKTETMTSSSKARRNNVKVETGTNDLENDSDIIRTPLSRRHSQGQVKIEAYASSESDSAKSIDSSDAETDSYTTERVSSTAHTKNCSSGLAKYQLATVKIQASRSSNVRPSPHRGSPETSIKNPYAESDDDGDLKDLPHYAIGTKEEQHSPEADSDYENGDDMTPADTKTLLISQDSDDENSDGGSFSGDSEYERAVVSHSQAIDGASARYGDTDTDSSSGSSYDNDTEIQPRRQPLVKKADGSSKATHNSSKSDHNSASKPTTNKADPTSTTLQSTRPKQLEIKRDRRPRPEELERAKTRETTPSRTPKKRTKQDQQHAAAVETLKPAAKAANVHPDMTYEDVHDPITRHKIARMRSQFPRETIHLCYIYLAKHNGDYDESCQELANASLTFRSEKPAQTTPQDAQVPSSSRKRKRSSIPKQVAAPKLQNHFALSDSDEPIIKQEPTPKRRKASRLEKRASLISDAMHGSQIDLTVLDDAEIAEEAESNTPAKKRGRKRGSHKRAIAHDKSSPRPLQAVSVEIPWVSAAKLRTAEREKNQFAFPSSPPTEMALKGILKSSPSFRSRKGLLSQTLDSAGMPLSHHQKKSSDLPLHPPRRKSEPDLPPQPPLRNAQQKVAPQHQVSWSPYTTESGWQALNPNRKSKMRPSGQIEEEAQPAPQRTLFPEETNRIVGLSRQDDGGLLQRGKVRNPSTSNSTSTERKHRQ